MKIVVLTKHYVKNYGSVLQTLATQEVLKQFCDEVVIGNYMRPEAVGANYMQAILKNRNTSNKLKTAVYKMILYPSVMRWEKIFGDFISRRLWISEKVCTDPATLYEDLPQADIYCTGSDMVWNDETNGGFLPAYFLEFVPPEKKKIAFAASFGKESFSPEQMEQLREKLKSYSAISVREETGVPIVEQLGLKAKNVLDPSLCVDKDFWEQFRGKNKYGDYILIYQLYRNKRFDEYVERLAKKKGVRVVRICTRYDYMFRGGKAVLLPKVEEWVNLFLNARYVATDSFHGTAFSLNLGKQLVALPPQSYETRITSILSLLGIPDRYVTDYNDMTIFDREIDYTKVHQLLNEQRQETLTFLKNAVSG